MKERRARAKESVIYRSTDTRKIRRRRQNTKWKDSRKKAIESVGLKEDVLGRTE